MTFFFLVLLVRQKNKYYINVIETKKSFNGNGKLVVEDIETFSVYGNWISNEKGTNSIVLCVVGISGKCLDNFSPFQKRNRNKK